MQLTKDQLHNLNRNSVFNKEHYTVSISSKDTLRSLEPYTGVNTIKGATPLFQRSNSSWSEGMQVAFCRNVLLGMKSEFLLYDIEGEEGNSKILDGLQRLTAWVSFLSGDLKVWGYTCDELVGLRHPALLGMRGNLSIKLYTFSNTNEAIDFYIQMNENITHSPEDIQKALSYKI